MIFHVNSCRLLGQTCGDQFFMMFKDQSYPGTSWYRSNPSARYPGFLPVMVWNLCMVSDELFALPGKRLKALLFGDLGHGAITSRLSAVLVFFGCKKVPFQTVGLGRTDRCHWKATSLIWSWWIRVQLRSAEFLSGEMQLQMLQNHRWSICQMCLDVFGTALCCEVFSKIFQVTCIAFEVGNTSAKALGSTS